MIGKIIDWIFGLRCVMCDERVEKDEQEPTWDAPCHYWCADNGQFYNR